MSSHIGNDGKIKVGSSNYLGELKEWSLRIGAATVEDTVLGDAWDTFLVGTKNWSGSASAHWDEGDTLGQEVLTAGASVALTFDPEGSDSGDTVYAGTAIVEEVTMSGALNGVVMRSFTFKGSGALTGPTVI